ncbi:hypothetical protein PM082_018408 [Marasmius tenuissimus]|nr:hypothetical protein PM082_018408 [Marasmius tenuissimus]
MGSITRISKGETITDAPKAGAGACQLRGPQTVWWEVKPKLRGPVINRKPAEKKSELRLLLAKSRTRYKAQGIVQPIRRPVICDYVFDRPYYQILVLRI